MTTGAPFLVALIPTALLLLGLVGSPAGTDNRDRWAMWFRFLLTRRAGSG